MSLLTVEGIYKDGKVELTERPERVYEAARVLVTFLPSGLPRDEHVTGEDHDRETLRQQAFARMKEGLHLGGPPYPKREEFYDRFER
jgi:hypothetical protein